MRKKILTTIGVTLLAFGFHAKGQSMNLLDVAQTMRDSTIIFPESFEMDTQKLLEGWYMRNYTSTDNRYESMPDVKTSEETIIKRLASLPTKVEIPYNPIVRTCIDRYVKDGRKQVAVILGLSLYYMPIFEQALEEAGLPLELKYLPVIESGLNPTAVSRSGAAGLWQFKIATAEGLGMEVSSLVDERYDPYISSKAAAEYLSELYSIYNDWSLAIAAYNAGPGNVNKAIRRAGGDASRHNFWTIYNYLSPETQGYFPTFIAANYVMNYHKEHNISPVLASKPLLTDTVEVRERVNLNQISAVLQLPIDALRMLNPQYRGDEIPASAEKPRRIVLPSQQVHAFIMSEDQIRNYNSEVYGRPETVEIGLMTVASNIEEPEDTMGELKPVSEPEGTNTTPPTDRGETSSSVQKTVSTTTIMHKVAAGETLASIADKYGVTQTELKQWNSLRRNAVRTGQQLKVRVATEGNEALIAESRVAEEPTPAPKAEPKKAESKKKESTANKKASAPTTSKTHKIKKGETLSSIASRYGVTVSELKKANNLRNDNIREGKTLTIPEKKSTGKRKKKRR